MTWVAVADLIGALVILFMSKIPTKEQEVYDRER